MTAIVQTLQKDVLRCKSLDVFRALIILLFILFNLLGTFVFDSKIPFFLKHNQGNVLLFVDLIAPAFAFVLGAALYFSHKKAFEAKTSFFRKRVLRFTQLIVLGIILDGLFCQGLFSFCLNWGVLQSLGLGGLFALLFTKLDNRFRIVLSLLLLIVYSQISVYSIPFWSADPFRHGGIVGAIGYGFISIFGFVSAGLFDQNKRKLLYFGALLFIAGMAASLAVPFNKLEVTASFILVSSSLSALFWLFLHKSRFSGTKFLNEMGRNSLTFWTLQYVVVWYPIAILNLWAAVKFDFPIGAALSILGIIFIFFVFTTYKRLIAFLPKPRISL